MKKCFIYLVSIMLSWTMVIISIGVPKTALAEEEKPKVYNSGDYEYIILEDGTIEITHYDGSGSMIKIPNELDGKTVTSIGNGAFFLSKVTSVSIPDSVTHLGENPFEYCNNLSSISVSDNHPTLAIIDDVLFSKNDKRLVYYPMYAKKSSYTIPQGIKIIGGSAFYGSALINIDIPDSVETIERSAFSLCKSLLTITVPDTVQTLGNGAFSSCKELKKIILGKGIKHLEDSVFAYCESLETITIPETVETIGDDAFFACKKLKSVSLGEIASMGSGVFGGCFELKNIVLPETLVYVGDNPFVGCSKINVEIANGNNALSLIDNVLFSKDDNRLIWYFMSKTDSKYQIPDNVEIIGGSAFEKARNLKEIIIPERVKYIGESAFSNCSSLESINIPEGITAIESRTFQYCNKLISLTVPQSVVKIGYGAFSNCSNLSSIVIPESVTEIGDSVFYKCDALTAVVTKDSFSEQYCKDNEVKYVYADAFDWLNN